MAAFQLKVSAAAGTGTTYLRQELFIYKDVNISDLVKYKIKVEEKKEDEECLFFASLFIMEDIDFLNKITLIDNFTQPFVYRPDNYNRTFIFPHSILEHYVFFNLTFIPQQSYSMTLKINDEDIEEKSGKQIINKTSTLYVSDVGIQNWCIKNKNQPCKLAFNYFQNNHENPALFYLGLIPYGVKPVYPPSPDPDPKPEPDPEK